MPDAYVPDGWVWMAIIDGLAWAGLVVFVIMYGLKHHGYMLPRRTEDDALTPYERLQRRYARGEINYEEFQARKARLPDPDRGGPGMAPMSR